MQFHVSIGAMAVCSRTSTSYIRMYVLLTRKISKSIGDVNYISATRISPYPMVTTTPYDNSVAATPLVRKCCTFKYRIPVSGTSIIMAAMISMISLGPYTYVSRSSRMKMRLTHVRKTTSWEGHCDRSNQCASHDKSVRMHRFSEGEADLFHKG